MSSWLNNLSISKWGAVEKKNWKTYYPTKLSGNWLGITSWGSLTLHTCDFLLFLRSPNHSYEDRPPIQYNKLSRPPRRIRLLRNLVDFLDEQKAHFCINWTRPIYQFIRYEVFTHRNSGVSSKAGLVRQMSGRDSDRWFRLVKSMVFSTVSEF